MPSENPQLEMILSIMNEFKEDMKSLRSSNHDIRDSLFGVTGQLDLIRQKTESDNLRNEKEIDVITSQLKENKIAIKELDNKLTSELVALKKLEPKVNSLFTTYTWVARAFVLAVVGAILALVIKR